MEKYDLSKYKYFGMAILICLIFFGAVIKAYQYIPNDLNKKTQISEITTEMKSEDVSANEETPEEQDKTQNDNTQTSENSTNEDNVTENNTEISKDKIEIDEIEKTFDEKYKKAENLVKNQKYTEAIDIYREIITLSSENTDKATAYEKIALIYASQKQYDSAMKYIQKSYTLNPTANTEVFIARLYYKTGEIDKATQRINHILKQDF